MNEVITLADGKIYYQDTDSLHIKEKDIEVLATDFKKKYRRVLIGKQMGQFHSDFESKLPELKDKKLYSERFISLGKKSYIDKLVADDCPHFDYHI